MNDLTNGKPLRLIFLFSIPVLLGNIFQQLYLMADTMMVGKLLGVDALAAMGASTTVVNLIIGFCVGMAMGVSVLVAQYYGAKDQAGMRHAIAGSYLICMITTILLSVISLFFVSPILKALKTPNSIMDMATIYLVILVIGIVVTMLYNLFASLLRAVGDSKTPLYFLMIASITNIILDYVFIAIVPIGIAGAAIATVIAQFLATILCYCYIRKRYPMFLVKVSDFQFEKQLLMKQLSMGVSMGLMNSIVSIGTIILQSAVNELGEITIAAHTAARKIVEMFMQPLISISIAVTTFVSQNLGAHKYGRILEGMKHSALLCLVWVIIVILLSYTQVEILLGFLIDGENQEVISIASFYTRIMSLFYFALSYLFLYRNALQGLGNGRIPIISSMIEMSVKIVVTFILVPKVGYIGVALAEPISWCLMSIVLVWYFYHSMHQFKQDFN